MRVISSRSPFTLRRRTQKPFCSLWKVTRSTRPARRSSVAGASDMEGCRQAACSSGTSLTEASTHSRSSLPTVKWGTYFSGTETATPVLGLRPVLAGR